MKETAHLNGYEAEFADGVLTIKGNGQEVTRVLDHALVDVDVEDDEVVFTSREENRKVKSVLGTFKSHVENIVDGLEEEHVYEMKGVYAHFPMTVKAQNNEVIIENFMGERNPRKVDIVDGVQVDIDGEDLEIRGPDKEAVGLTAGRIEQACKKGNRDPRTFQDGVYITKKGEEK